MAATLALPCNTCAEPTYTCAVVCPPAPICFVGSIEALPVDLSLSVLEALEPQERRALRSLCRKSRVLINGVTTKLCLQGEDLFYFSTPALGARFPSLKELVLRDGAGPGTVEELVLTNAHGLVTDASIFSTFEEPIWTVQRLDLKRCAFLSPAGVRALLSFVFPNVEVFAASRWASSASLLDVPHCDKLRELDLGDIEVDVSTIDDGALAVVARCTQLRRLSLQRCVAITDAGLAHLVAEIAHLQHLDISHTRLTGDGLALLQHTGLTSLRAQGCSGLRDSGLIGAATALPRLTSLCVAACPGITNAGLAAALPHLPALTTLDLGTQFELSAEGLAALAFLPALATLTLGSFNMLPPPPVLAVEAGPGGELWPVLPPPSPSPSRRNPIILPALSSLQFGGAWPNRGLRRALPLGPALRKVRVVGFDAVVDGTAAALARQQSLTELELAGGYTLTPRGLMALSRLPALATLTLSSCPLISEADAAAFMAACVPLARLILRTSSHGGAKDSAGVTHLARAHPAVVAAAAAAAAAAAEAQAAQAAAAEAAVAAAVVGGAAAAAVITAAGTGAAAAPGAP